MDINPFYSYIENAFQSIPDIQPKALMNISISQGSDGCVVTDSTKQYIFITALQAHKEITSYSGNNIDESYHRVHGML